MFKNLANWTNRKLRYWRIIANLGVIVLGYIVPLIVVLAMCWSSKGDSSWKIPITAIVIFCAIVFGLTHFLKGTIAKISIYDNKSQTLKHILEVISRLIVPITLIVISSIFATWLKEQIAFYNKMIIIVLSFYSSGILIDRLVLGFLDDEYYIREKAKENNAVQARQSIVNGE